MSEKARIERLEGFVRAGESAKEEIETLRKNCNHNWSSPVYDPKVIPGYRDPGDTPGTMGVDFHGPQYIPEQRTERWKRTCENCAKVEYTTDAKPSVSKVPVFR